VAGVGNGIAFSTATVSSYFLNSVSTFRSKVAVGSLRPFVVVAFMGLSATVAMTTAIQNAGYPYQVGIMAVVAFVPWRRFSLQKI
jgi:putative flippase GtrA